MGSIDLMSSENFYQAFVNMCIFVEGDRSCMIRGFRTAGILFLMVLCCQGLSHSLPVEVFGQSSFGDAMTSCIYPH